MTWLLDCSTRTKALLFIPAPLALIQAASLSPPSHRPLSMSNALALTITTVSKTSDFKSWHTLESPWGTDTLDTQTPPDQLNENLWMWGLASVFQSSADDIHMQPRDENHWSGYPWCLTPPTTIEYLHSEDSQDGARVHHLPLAL